MVGKTGKTSGLVGNVKLLVPRYSTPIANLKLSAQPPSLTAQSRETVGQSTKNEIFR